MARSDVWSGSWLDIERAREHVRDLERKITDFMVRQPYSAVVAQERATGHHVISARVDEQPPVSWSAIAADAVHNLRSALDLTARQLVLANGSRPTSETGFPIAESAADYEAVRLARLRGVSDAVVAQIGALRPYRRGNASLWRIHALDVAEGHVAFRPVVAVRKGLIDVTSSLDFPNTPILTSPGYPNRALFPIETGTELARVYRSHTTA